MLGSSSLGKKWVFAYRYADVDSERPRRRFTGDYQLAPNVQIGFEWNLAVEELAFRGTWVLSRASETSPQVHFNTSSDRIGSPEGTQQYSITATQAIHDTPFAPYVSLTYSEWDDGFVLPFGLNYQIAPEWGLIGMNDGRRSHLLLTYSRESYYLQLGWIWLKHPAITAGWGF